MLGAPVAEHKGYGLVLMVDTLGVLAGNGSWIFPSGTPARTQGQWFAVWRPDLFVDPDEFLADASPGSVAALAKDAAHRR